MSKRTISRKLLVVVLCIVIVAALIGYYYFVMLPSTGPVVEEVRVGQIVPLTGPLAGFGGALSWELSKAVEDINKLGGVKLGDKRVPVRVILYDDASDPTKTTSLTTQAILIDNVIAIFGCGPLSVYTSIPANSYGAPNIAIGPFEPWWAAGPYNYSWLIGFRIGTPIQSGDPRAGKPGYTILDAYFGFTDKFANQTNKKVAVLACDDADGRGWYSIFGPALANRGYEPYGLENNVGLYPPGTSDFSSIIIAWKDFDCEILWGNLPGPDFGVFWRQAASLGWRPKMALIGRAALYPEDVKAWGGDLPLGVATEIVWDPSYPYLGIGDRTPESLAEEWIRDKRTGINVAMAYTYSSLQVLADAIERAGTIDKDAINKAIAETDIVTLMGRVKFTATHDSPIAVTLGQWVKTDNPWVWECPIVYSVHPDIHPTHEPIFPLPPVT